MENNIQNKIKVDKNKDVQLANSLNNLNYQLFKIISENEETLKTFEIKEQFINDLINYINMSDLSDDLSIFGINCCVKNDELDTIIFKRKDYSALYETILNKEKKHSCAKFGESFYSRLENANSLGNINFSHNIYVNNENQIIDMLKLRGPIYIDNPTLYKNTIEGIVNKAGYEICNDIKDDLYTGGIYKNSSIDEKSEAPFYKLLNKEPYKGTNQYIQVWIGLEGITYQECINKSKDFNEKCSKLYPLLVETFKRIRGNKIKKR